MHVDAHVALRRYRRLPGVDAHADSDRTAPERLLRLTRGGDSIRSVRERDEQRIALGVDLHAIVLRDRRTKR